MLLLIVCFALRLLSMPDETYTYDEGQHLNYGHRILSLNSNRLEAELWVSPPLVDGWRATVDGQELMLVKGNRALRHEIVRSIEGGWDVRGLDASKMPVSALNALPGKLGSLFPSVNKFLGGLPPARYVTVFTSLLLGYLCFHWSRQVYGFGAGLFALFLFAFEPNLLAHSQLVTTDLYGAATMTLALYAAWRYALAKDAGHSVVLGIAMGLSQLAKYSAVFLWILIPAIILLTDSSRLVALIREKNGRGARTALGQFFFHGAIVAIIALLLINAGYLFNRSLRSLDEYVFYSDAFRSIQSAFAPASFVRVPLPYPYLEGLDLTSFEERSGFGYGRVYLLGHLSREGFPGYYLIAFLFKVPLAIQVLCLLAAIAYLADWKSDRFRRAELFMLVPVLFFTFYLNLFNRAQNGIRFLLIIFPLIFVFCGSLIARWGAANRHRKLVILALGSYLVVSVLSYFPHYIPYFNELVYDRKFAYKILADSNIDWGQNGGYLARYLQEHPATRVRPEKPVAGRIVVDVNRLTGVIGDPDRFAWLRENFSPSDTIAHAYLVFDVPAKKLEAISPDYQNHETGETMPPKVVASLVKPGVMLPE